MSTRLVDLLPNPQRYWPLALLAIVGGIVGSRSIFQMFAPYEATNWVILLAACYFVAVIWYTNHRLARFPELSHQHTLFRPFALKQADGRDPDIWPRYRELERLLERLDESHNCHLILTGPSGAGKTTFLSKIVRPSIEARGVPWFSVDTYDRLTMAVLEQFPQLNDSLIVQVRAALSTDATTLHDVLSASPVPQLDDLFDQLRLKLDEAFSAQPRVFIAFDQVERLLSSLQLEQGSRDQSRIGPDLYLFIKLLRYFREHDRYRTILVLRSEYMYSSIEFLEFIAYRHSASRNQIISYFLCPGINAESSPEGIAAIRAAFQKIKGASSFVDNFVQANNLDSPARSNTFLAQLYGYIVEYYYAADPRVRSSLERGDPPKMMMGYYFDYLLNDYERLYNILSSSDVEFLKAVMFSIAIENKVGGNAVTNERIALLTHLPLSYVKTVTHFLLQNGLLLEETTRGDISYRLIHEIIADYVLENEQLAINSRLKDGIQGLSEARAVPATVPKRFETPVRDLAPPPTLGAFALAVFFVHGILKLRFDTVCTTSHDFLSFMPLAVPCDADPKYFAFVFIVDCVWLWFIYRVSYGYFAHVLRPSWLRVAGTTLPLLGATGAVAFSHSPGLFIIPIAVLGTLMGLFLVIGCANGSFRGRVRQENLTWGLLTLGNMTIATLLTTLVAAPFKPDWIRSDQVLHLYGWTVDVKQAIVIFACLVMFYFWIHIQNKQQSRESIAARLALHDRAQVGTDV